MAEQSYIMTVDIYCLPMAEQSYIMTEDLYFTLCMLWVTFAICLINVDSVALDQLAHLQSDRKVTMFANK